MNLRVIALLIILSLTIRGKPVEESIRAVKASPVMPDKAKQAKVKRAKSKKAKLKAADKKAVDFMNSSLGEWIIEYSGSKDIDPFLIFAIAERESGLNPNAVGDNGASIGLTQIQPRGCVKVAIDILLEYKEKDSDLYFVLMAYNGGVAYAKRHINTPSDYAVKVSERAVELNRLYEVGK